jgi:transcriptional regulator with XRE-family HTH domain
MGLSKIRTTLLASAVSSEESALAKKRIATTPEGAIAIGRRLAELRKAKGLTQVDVGAALGIAQGLLSKYECGDLLLHGELIIQFARVLGVSSDDILGIDSRRAKPAVPAIDKTLARRLAQLQALPRRDRDTLLRTLDAFLVKSSARAA